MKQPVCLIIPPSGFLLDERVFLPLGVLKVAASLERAGHPVEVLDLAGVKDYLKVVGEHVVTSSANVYGITATTPQLPAAVKIARLIRLVRPKERDRIILGGPHVTLTLAAVKQDRIAQTGRAGKHIGNLIGQFDILVAGDGEDAIFEAIRAYAPSVIDADNPDGPLFIRQSRLQDYPWPARHLVDVASYHYTIDGVKATSLIAQLGCPFACAFCGGRNSPSFRRMRLRPTSDVLAEVAHLNEIYGFRGFMFYDDELNVNKQMVELMNGLADLRLDLRLRGFVKAELFTDEQAAAMVRAGFRWVLVGFESGSPRILENINKKATREDNTRCLRIAHKHGLKVKALMSLGHPGETHDTILQTLGWLVSERPDDFDCTIITPYPGTPYYDEAVPSQGPHGIEWAYTAKSGDHLYSWNTDFSHETAFYKGAPGEYKSLVATDSLTADQIVTRRDHLEMIVRKELAIPYNTGNRGVAYEASMGQLPGHILRKSS